MIDTTNVEEFFRHNDHDLRRIIGTTCYATHLRDDVRGEFYLRSAASGLLEDWDASRSSLSTFCFGCCRCIATEISKQDKSFPKVKIRDDWPTPVSLESQIEAADRIGAFGRYIYQTYPPELAHQMLLFLRSKISGQTWDDMTGIGYHARNNYYLARARFKAYEQCLGDSTASMTVH